jgi:hypothetical protein
VEFICSVPKATPVLPKTQAPPPVLKPQAEKIPSAVFKEQPKDIVQPKTLGSPIQINEPKDLENFAYENLGAESTESIKRLAKNFGYYEVIFHLEKSPMYKAYISTGSKLLETSKSLDESGSKAHTGLDKQKFEKVADLLREIQAE